jgi:hypothetical protein
MAGDPMTDISKTADLQMPYRTHSRKLLQQVRENCEVIYFFDHSVARKIDGKWSAIYPGAFDEAQKWCESK